MSQTGSGAGPIPIPNGDTASVPDDDAASVPDDGPALLILVAADGASIGAALVDRFRARVFGDTPVVLSPGRAIEIPCEVPPRLDRLRTILAGRPIDLFVTSTAHRRKRLLVADMDGTIVDAETLDELARRAGSGEAVAEITRRSMAGEVDFATSLRLRVATLRGLPVAALADTWRDIRPNPGARSLVATMRAHGAQVALVSGGFTFFAERVADLLGFDGHHANVLAHENGRLTGEVQGVVLDAAAKRDTLDRLARASGLRRADTAAVGDGANDIPMLTRAGLAVGYRPKPVVAAAVANRIEHGTLRAILYAQGFHDDEIAGDEIP